MDKKNNESYSKGTILIVLILFMFSSKLLNIAWDIGKSLIFIIIIIYCLNIFNPNIATTIKEILNDIINTESNNIFKNILAKVASFISNTFKIGKSDDTDETEISTKKKFKSETNAELDNSKVSNLRNLDNEPNNVGRKLA